MRKAMRACPTVKYLTDWTQFCRDVMTKDIIRQPRNTKVGGPGKVIVIDETALAKRKYYCGRPVACETIWVLVIYDVENKVGILVWIQNRGHAAVIPKIREHVELGSTLYTDELRTYGCLGRQGYDHHTVDHSQEFVNAQGVHTNHIEGYFS